MSSSKGRSVVLVLLGKASHFVIIFAYLWLLLSVYALHNSIVLADWHLLGHLGPAMLKALIFAKFVLIGEHLRLGDQFKDRPLIWPILIKAALFSALLIGFDYLEGVIVHAIWPHAGADEGPEMNSLRTSLSFGMMTFVALLPFFGIRELSEVIGEKQMRKLFFSSRTAVKVAAEA